MKYRDWLIFAGIFILPVFPALFMSPALLKVQTQVDPYQRSLEELKAIEPLWLDARTQKDYDKKHVPGSLLMTFEDWEGSLARLFEVFDPEMTIVVYCGPGCDSSKAVAKRLREELGVDTVYFLKGGMQAWFAAHK